MTTVLHYWRENAGKNTGAATTPLKFRFGWREKQKIEAGNSILCPLLLSCFLGGVGPLICCWCVRYNRGCCLMGLGETFYALKQLLLLNLGAHSDMVSSSLSCVSTALLCTCCFHCCCLLCGARTTAFHPHSYLRDWWIARQGATIEII